MRDEELAMIGRRGWWTVAVVAAIAAAVGTFALLRKEPAPGEREQRKLERMALELSRATLAECKTIPAVDVGDLASVGDVRALLGELRFSNALPAGAGSVDALIDEIAQFLYFRFVLDDSHQYVAWRRERGYEFLSPEEVRGWSKNYYRFVTGQEMPNPPDVEPIFHLLWEKSEPMRGGASRVVSIASAAKGLAGVFGVQELNKPHRWALVSGEMSADLWQSASAGTYSPWFGLPRTREELLRAHERLVYARVGLVLGFANGIKRPIVLTYFWDPERRFWRHEITSACALEAVKQAGLVH